MEERIYLKYLSYLQTHKTTYMICVSQGPIRRQKSQQVFGPREFSKELLTRCCRTEGGKKKEHKGFTEVATAINSYHSLGQRKKGKR